MRTLVVQQDVYEKRPYAYPELWLACVGQTRKVFKIEVQSGVNLRTGDIRLKSSTGFRSVLIERKWKHGELWGCFLGGDVTRCRDQLRRLRSSAELPVLLIDTSPHSILSFCWSRIISNAPSYAGELLLQGIIHAATDSGVTLIWSSRQDDSDASKLSSGKFALALLTSPPSSPAQATPQKATGETEKVEISD